MTVPLLTIENLHVSYLNLAGSKEVLHGISMHLDAGEALALVGESGSGKSVTAQAIMRLLGRGGSITDGRIDFDGIPLLTIPEQQMNGVRGKRIGMIFQDPMTSLNPTMRVGKQIAEAISLHEKVSSGVAKEKATELIRAVGIGDAKFRYDAYPFELSGGMRQRIIIAIAVACKPDLLIADEPTTALDVTVQAQILDLLRALMKERRMSLLFITHDLRVASRLCSRVLVMYQGTIVESGTAASIFSAPQHPYTRSLMAACQPELCHA